MNFTKGFNLKYLDRGIELLKTKLHFYYIINYKKENKSMDKSRRSFISKNSLLMMFGLLSPKHLYENSENLAGIVLRKDEGEIFYIGNERKSKVTIKVAKSEMFNPAMSLCTEVIPRGDGIPEHKHLNEDEFIFIHEGIAQVKVGEEITELTSSDLAYIPEKTWHGLKNINNKDVLMFFGYSPAGFEDYFRSIGVRSPNQSLGFTREDWVRTNRKYGIVYRNE